jgi:hypothetical protein
MRDFDPYLLEVLRSAFDTIADNMAITVMRTALFRDRSRIARFFDSALRSQRIDTSSGCLHADASRQLP